MSIKQEINFSGNAAAFAAKARGEVGKLRDEVGKLNKSTGLTDTKALKSKLNAEQMMQKAADTTHTRRMSAAQKFRQADEKHSAAMVRNAESAQAKLVASTHKGAKQRAAIEGRVQQRMGQGPGQIMRGGTPANTNAQSAAGGGLGVGSAALGAGVVVAGVAVQFGKMAIEAASFKQGTIKGLEVITKSGTEARRIWEESFKMARDLGQRQDETVRSMQSLMGAGFSEKTSSDLIKAMADLKVVRPDANFEGITRAISQIKAAGRLQGDELNQLAEAGLSTDLVYKALGKRLGKTTFEIRKMQEAGQLTADIVIPSILEGVQGLTGKNELGDLAKENNKSLGSLIHRLKEAPDRILRGIEADSAGASKLHAAMVKLDAIMDPTTEEGKQLIVVLNQIASASLDAGAAGLEKFAALRADLEAIGSVIEPVLAGLASGVNQIRGIFGLEGTASADGFKSAILSGLGDGLGGMGLVLIEQIGGAIQTAKAAIGPAGATFMAEAGVAIGEALVLGIVGVLVNAGPRLASAAGKAASAAVGGAKSALGIASPSKVMADEVAEPMIQGVERPIENAGPRLDAAVAGMMGGATSGAPSAGAPAFSGGAGGGGPISATFHITVSGVGDEAQAAKIGRSLGAAASESFNARFGRHMRGMAEAA